MSRAKLGRGVITIIESRKPFVVTSDYVRPDRRSASRDGEGEGGAEVPLIRAPNSLRRKATGTDDGVDVNEVANTVRHKRVEAYINRVLVTVDMISNADGGNGGAAPGSMANVAVLLGELGAAAGALRQSIGGTRFRHQSALCDSIAEVAERLSRQLVPAGKDLELVRQLTLALQIAVHSDDETLAAAAIDVTALVSAQGAAD